jgi:hypothetical protein
MAALRLLSICSGAALFTALAMPTSALAEGGETIDDATPIAGLPYTDTGDTSDNVNDYDEVCPFSGSTAPDVVY